MPITLTYDLLTQTNNDRSYLRSMLERFHWERLGGSVFRYRGSITAEGDRHEDWLNDVIPSLMFLRSYVLEHGISFRFLTLDVSSVAHVDFSDDAMRFGTQALMGRDLVLADPTNQQSSVATIRAFVDTAAEAT